MEGEEEKKKQASSKFLLHHLQIYTYCKVILMHTLKDQTIKKKICDQGIETIYFQHFPRVMHNTTRVKFTLVKSRGDDPSFDSTTLDVESTSYRTC